MPLALQDCSSSCADHETPSTKLRYKHTISPSSCNQRLLPLSRQRFLPSLQLCLPGHLSPSLASYHVGIKGQGQGRPRTYRYVRTRSARCTSCMHVRTYVATLHDSDDVILASCLPGSEVLNITISCFSAHATVLSSSRKLCGTFECN